MGKEKTLKRNMRAVHKQKTDGIKIKRWRIPRMQIYPGGYISEGSKIESLLDISDYSHACADKQAGLYQLGEDIFRMNVKFVGVPGVLREKAAKAGIDVKLLQKQSSAQATELEKVKALFPQHLHPRLLELLIYNLHQNSLAASPEKILLKDILLYDYKFGLRAQDSANTWTTRIKIAKDGNSFSITNTQVVNRRLDLSGDADIVDPRRSIEVSSTLSFSIGKNDGKIQVRREFYMKSPDTGRDEGIIEKFGNRISEAIANQDRFRYQSKFSNEAPQYFFDEVQQYQAARDYYEACLIAYKEQLDLPAMLKDDNPVVKSGFDFLRTADAAVQQDDANQADLTTIFEFQACQLCQCMPEHVTRPEMPKSLNQSPTENECTAAINSLTNSGKRNLASKACIAVGTLLAVTAFFTVAVVLKALCPPVGCVFTNMMAPKVTTATESAFTTLDYVVRIAVGAADLKAQAMRVRDVQSAPELTHVGMFKVAMNDPVIKDTEPTVELKS